MSRKMNTPRTWLPRTCRVFHDIFLTSSLFMNASLIRPLFHRGRSMFLFQVKIPGYVKSEINISIAPGARRLSKILCFQHALGIAEYQLEYMASRLNIPT